MCTHKTLFPLPLLVFRLLSLAGAFLLGRRAEALDIVSLRLRNFDYWRWIRNGGVIDSRIWLQ